MRKHKVAENTLLLKLYRIFCLNKSIVGVIAWFTFISSMLSLVYGCASTAEIQRVEAEPVIPVFEDETSKAIHFEKIVVDLPQGTDLGATQIGFFCIPDNDLTDTGGRRTIVREGLTSAFRRELEAANYRVVSDSEALFDDPFVSRAEYRIAGVVDGLRANICFPKSGFGDFHTAKGEGFLQVNWKIFSRVEGRIVYELTTQGTGSVEDAVPGGEDQIFLAAFSRAVQNLLADQRFHDLMTGKAKVAEDVSLSQPLVIPNPGLSHYPLVHAWFG